MNKQHFRLLIIITLISVFSGCTNTNEDRETTDNTYEPIFSGITEDFGDRWRGSGSDIADTLFIYAVNAEDVIVASQFYIPEESTKESRLIPVDEPIRLEEDGQYRLYGCRKTYIPVQGTKSVISGLSIVQNQKKGNDKTHIHNYDFIYAKAEIVNRQVQLKFQHSYALLELELPAGVRAITLQAADLNEEYSGVRNFSLNTGDWNNHIEGFPFINLQLTEPTTTENEKAWLLIYPGHKNTSSDLIVQTTDYKIYRIPHTTPDNGYQSGQTYPLKVNLQQARETLTPPGNDGESWLIGSATELQWFRDNVNSGSIYFNAILSADIDLQGSAQNPWCPIGATFLYIGHFNGNGYHISRLYINNTKNETGFFAQLNGQGCIENLKLSGEITDDNNLVSKTVGGIVGHIHAGTVQQCQSSVKISLGGNSPAIGGIAGYSFGTIRDCYYDGEVYSSGTNSHIGTILGGNLQGIVERCYSIGSLSYRSIVAGGICGGNDFGSEIRYCVALCRGWQYIGNIYSTSIGRITGYNSGTSHHNIAMRELKIGTSFSDSETIQGISKDREECLSPQLYTDELGWSPEIWRFAENTLPTLRVLK